MTATAKTKQRRWTWRKLIPQSDLLDPQDSPELITRDEVLARVTALGAPVTRDRLRRWEQEGKLPIPERMGFPAKTMYPAFAVDYIAVVPAMLEAGLSWPEITRQIEMHPGHDRWQEIFRRMTTPTTADLIRAVEQHAKAHAERTGQVVDRVELVMRNKDGHIVGRTMIGWGDFLNPEQSERLGRMVFRVRAEDS